MTTVLVTGVGGFIGSHVAESCQRQGFTVVGLDDLSGGFKSNVPAGVHFIEGSICDAALVARLFKEFRFDYVYHLAAYAAEGLSHFIRSFNYNNNLIGSVNLINQSALAGVRCFVFTSSIAVYGSGQTPMSEGMTPEPEDPYGVAKYAIELDLKAARRMFGLPFVVFRPHNVYGERQNLADRYRNVVGIFMNQVMKDAPMTIFGSGHQSRAFSHINDVAPLIAKAPLIDGAYGEVFNVGADEPCSVLHLAHTIARAFDVEPRIEHLPAREETEHAFASHEKLRQVFGEHATVPLNDGIGKMAAWARRAGPMTPVPLRELEVDLNVPPSWRKGR
jgi:UDP-glucose 4-epimerase